MSGRANDALLVDLFPELPLADRNAIAADKERRYMQYLDAGVTPLSGLHSLLELLHEKEIPYAVVTNAPRNMAECTLKALGLWHCFAQRIVSAEECPNAKPEPDPYIAGKKLIGIYESSKPCVAFEDTPSGVKSATAAGIGAIGVLTSHSEETLLKSGALFCIKNFDDNRIARIVRREE